MYCKYCGNQITDDSIFCSFCGKHLRSTSTISNAEILDNLNFKDNEYISFYEERPSSFNFSFKDISSPHNTNPENVVPPNHNNFSSLEDLCKISLSYVESLDYNERERLRKTILNRFSQEQINKLSHKIRELLQLQCNDTQPENATVIFLIIIISVITIICLITQFLIH